MRKPTISRNLEIQGELSSTYLGMNYAEFQVSSTPWGLGRSWQAASDLTAVCGTYFGNGSRQKSIVRPYAGRDAVSFQALQAY